MSVQRTILSSLSHNEDVWKVQISHVIEIQIVQPQFYCEVFNSYHEVITIGDWSAHCGQYYKICDVIFTPSYRAKSMSMDALHSYLLWSVQRCKYEVVNFIIQATGYISYIHQNFLTIDNVKQIFKKRLSEPVVIPFWIHQSLLRPWSQVTLDQI